MAYPRWYLDLSEELANNINAWYMPLLVQLIEELGVQGGDIGAAQTAVSTAPAPLTPDTYLGRTPYQTRQIVIDQLEGATERGTLAKVGDEAYVLTEAGQKLATRIAATAVAAAHTVTSVSNADGERLAALLRRVVDGCVAAAEPSHPNLNRSRFYDPGVDAPVVERVRRYLNDLFAFRDDAHIAAWRSYDLAGYEWEAFSHIHGDYVFGEAVATAVELAEKLGGFRGYEADAYEAVLRKVAARGWLMAEDGRYTVTAEGEQVREAVEAETDALFFAPWPLKDVEIEQVRELMAAWHTALMPPAAKDVWGAVDAARQAVAQIYWPVLQAKAEEVGFEGWDLLITRRATVLEDGVTPAYLAAFMPYVTQELILERLNGTAGRGFIAGSADGGYRVSETGQQAVTAVMSAAANALADIELDEGERVERTAVLLQKLSDTINAAAEPEIKAAIADSRRLFPADSPLALWRINSLLTDIVNFRDDAHVAAWRPYELPGYQWEAFSHVWGENVWGEAVATAVQVAEKLAFRGYNEAAYVAALDDCCLRGLLKNDNGTYEVTKAGQKLRQEAEEATDRIFFAPWAGLHAPEMVELKANLEWLVSAISHP